VVGKFDFQPGTSNFLSLVSRLKGLQFDGVITAALDAEATPLIRAMGQAGIRGTEVASFGMAPERVGKQAGRYAEGVRVAQYFDPEKPTNDTARAFVEAYRAEYGEVPTTYGTEGYNAGLMLVAAIEKAQSSDPQKIRDALAGLRDVPTAFGPLTFDEHNQVTHGIVIQQIKDTKPVTVATAG
jgi:branched-chain amino acid transport system substrate-binding protein